MDEKVLEQLENVPSNAEDAFKGLTELCNFYAKLNNISEEEQKRLNYELDLIKKWGIAKIFLFAYELHKSENVPSSILIEGNSYINYLLKISAINPVVYDLPFERFFNEYRRVLPEYSLYVEKGRKGLILKNIYEKFGKSSVLRSKDNVSTYFISSRPINEDLIKERVIVAKENEDAYEENVSILTRRELYDLGYYYFSVLEFNHAEYSSKEKFSEEEIYQKTKNMFPSEHLLKVSAFMEIENVKDILVNTKYKLVYQEQVIEILNKICGVDLSKSDYFRRELVKAKRPTTEEIKTILINKYGNAGENLYEYLIKYARYTVLKAHVIANLHNLIEY